MNLPDSGSGPSLPSSGESVFRRAVFDPAELSLIREAQGLPVVEPEHDVFEADRIDVGRHRQKRAGHAEVHDQAAVVVEVDQEVLAAAPDVDDRAVPDESSKRIRSIGPRTPGKSRTRMSSDGPADEQWEQGPANSFDFREFRHGGW